MKFELVSFSLCPYVQRSVIALKHKSVPFTFREIDLENPPEWFLKLSPMGKVPVLIVDGRTAIFESAVINEYIDEVAGKGRLLPADPLERARERSWIEYASELLMSQYRLLHEADREQARKGLDELLEDLKRLEPVLNAKGPLFGGQSLSLADASYAPLFTRLSLIDTIWKDPRWKGMPKTRRWAETLLALPEVRDSVRPDFAQAFLAYVKESGSALLPP